MKSTNLFTNKQFSINGNLLKNHNIDYIFKHTIFGKPLISKVYTRFHNLAIKHNSGIFICHLDAFIRTENLLKRLEKR